MSIENYDYGEYEKNRQCLMHELICEQKAQDEIKDIIMVVYNQFDYTKRCIETIFENTSNFNLYIWDNASNQDTADFLRELDEQRPDVFLHRNEENIGFIEPNNRLVREGKAPYIILLNSDTEVRKGWDLAMLGYLQEHPEVAQVGYLGASLGRDGRPKVIRRGSDIDYVMGWATCFRRSTYWKYGLFDKNMSFAFFEDSDFSLRLKTAGHELYALFADYVMHHGNATIKEVEKERNTLVSFQANRAWFLAKWEAYLENC